MYDFNTILKVVNLTILGLLFYTLFVFESNDYINSWSLFLGIILSLQTHVALYYERKYRDPFVVLLSYYMVFYYSLRILTLVFFPESHVFDRYEYGPDDSNYSLIFIIISNTFLYLGLFSKKTVEPVIKHINYKTLPSNLIVYFYMFLIFFIQYFLGNRTDLVAVLKFLFAPNVAIAILLIYYILYKKQISKLLKISIVLFIFWVVFYQMLHGSRYSIVNLFETLFIVLLSIYGFIKLPRQKVYFSAIFSPIIVILLFFSYVVITDNRKITFGKHVEASKLIEISSVNMQHAIENVDVEYFLTHITGRIGYFDFSSEIIAHKDRYKSVFNYSTYAKSFIDNIITPGFDLFNQPKIANSLVFIYRYNSEPLKTDVADKYQSDQLGIHGELYALFGYLSVILFFLTGYFFKTVYNYLIFSYFDSFLYRFFLLFLFTSIIKSFGFDWVVLFGILMFLSIQINKQFFKYHFR